MADSRQIYQEVILDHNRKPRNFGDLAQPSHRAEGFNPLCGDHIWVSLELAQECIAQIAFRGDSCAICKASASMMTGAVKGKAVSEVEQLIEEFRGMTTGQVDLAARPHRLGRLTVFAGIKDLPARVKCAILPWHTLHAALNNASSATTEGDAEPMAGVAD